MKLADKVLVVTGAASGIARAVTLEVRLLVVDELAAA